MILALLALFVAKPGSLTGFAQLVPAVFDVHLYQAWLFLRRQAL